MYRQAGRQAADRGVKPYSGTGRVVGEEETAQDADGVSAMNGREIRAKTNDSKPIQPETSRQASRGQHNCPSNAPRPLTHSRKPSQTNTARNNTLPHP